MNMLPIDNGTSWTRFSCLYNGHILHLLNLHRLFTRWALNKVMMYL